MDDGKVLNSGRQSLGRGTGVGQCSENHREGAGSSEQARKLTGQTEYPTTNDAIDDQGSHRPAPH